MNKRKPTTKQLLYLKVAFYVQQIAMPYIREGGHSLSSIYINHVVKEIPICMNTFRKMMKADVSQLPQLLSEYQKKATDLYLGYLRRQRKKRIQRKRTAQKAN